MLGDGCGRTQAKRSLVGKPHLILVYNLKLGIIVSNLFLFLKMWTSDNHYKEHVLCSIRLYQVGYFAYAFNCFWLPE